MAGMALWCIESLEITGGFLADLKLRFPRGLTCVIGPRGSGKSTLAEALRLVLSGLPVTASKSRLELIKANLGASAIALRTADEKDRAGFTVRRGFGQTPVVSAVDGRPITTIDLDRGSFLPIDAYSSSDVEAIADESLGPKRRSLLDDLRGSELDAIQLHLSEDRRALEANADGITAVEKHVRDLTEQIEELGDVDARLAALPSGGAREGTAEFRSASGQRQLNEGEGTRIAAARRQLAEFVPKLKAEALSGRRGVVGAATGSANDALVDEAARMLVTFWRVVDSSIAAIELAASSTAAELERVASQLKAAHLAQESTYLALQQENQEAARIFEARAAAERDVAAVVALRHERAEAESRLRDLAAQRRALKAEYVLTRDKISELREAVAQQLQNAAGPRVQIRVQRNADTLEYRQQLLSALYGSKLKNQDEILRSLSSIRPDELGQILRDDDLAELDTHAILGRERAKKVMESLRTNLDPLALDTLVIDDRIIIELDVSSDGARHFKDAAELSRGQKCTALLPILLARRESPLLIDQPEDNLDNHFIYQTVVESINRLRSTRQMIFITHNANIPVLGEADLVVVMNSDGRRGFVEKAGTVDECRTHIIDLLEGGAEAFELRRKRYES
jgi:energy-coupling factor transporter ATP-binding protein EcfA2